MKNNLIQKPSKAYSIPSQPSSNPAINNENIPKCVKGYFETHSGSIIPFNKVLYATPVTVESNKCTFLRIIISDDFQFTCELSQLDNYKRWLEISSIKKSYNER